MTNRNIGDIARWHAARAADVDVEAVEDSTMLQQPVLAQGINWKNSGLFEEVVGGARNVATPDTIIASRCYFGRVEACEEAERLRADLLAGVEKRRHTDGLEGQRRGFLERIAVDPVPELGWKIEESELLGAAACHDAVGVR